MKIEEIKTLFAQGHVDETLAALTSLKLDAFEERIMTLQSDFNTYTAETFKGILSSEQKELTRNRINDRILTLISQIEKAETRPVEKGNTQSPGYAIQNKYLTNVPTYYLENLIGREKELELLHKKLKTQSKLVLVSGIGGVGKTSLVAAYTTKYANAYKHIAWVNLSYETDLSQESHLWRHLVNSELTSIEQLHLISQGNSEKEGLVLLNKLRNLPNGPHLLIIDNAINHDFGPLQRYFGQMGQWHIIITSRHYTALKSFESIKLELFNKKAAIKTFEHYLERPLSKKEIKKLDVLLVSVGFHTLVIELMAKTMNALQMEITELIQDFEDNGLKIFKPEQVTPELYQKSINTDTILGYVSSLFNLQSLTPEESQILKYFSVMPSQFIPFNDLTVLLCISPEKQRIFRNALSQLFAKGWLIREANTEVDNHSSHKIHRLVQEIVFDQLQPRYPEDLQNLAIGITKCLAYDEFDLDKSINNPAEKYKWLIYYDHLIKFLPIIEDDVIINMHTNFAEILTHKGNYIRCVDIYKKSLKFYESRLESKSKKSNHIRCQLGLTLEFSNKSNEAIEILEEAVEIATNYHNDDKLHLMICRLRLGRAYCTFGQFEKAKMTFEEAIAESASNFDENHPIILDLEKEFSAVLNSLGEDKQAKDLLDKVLRSAIPLYGINHPNIIYIKHALGRVLRGLGEFQKSMELHEELLESVKKSFGETSTIYTIQIDLGITLNLIGEYAKAKELLEQIIKNINHQFGEESPMILATYFNLAVALNGLGEHQKAKELHEQVIQDTILQYGENTPSLITYRENLAMSLNGLKEYQKVKELYEQIIADVIHQYGDSTPSLITHRSNLGRALDALGNFQEAKELYEQVIDAVIQQYGKDYPHLTTYYSDLGIVLKKIGAFEKSESLLKHALEEEIRHHTKNHIYMPAHYKNLAFLYLVTGQWDWAQSHFMEALNIGTGILNPDHRYIKEAKRGLDIVDKLLKFSKKKQKKLLQLLERIAPAERELFLHNQVSQEV